MHEWFVTADGEFFRPSGPASASYPLVTYVSDGIASAMAQAKAAAGDRNVHVLGAYTAQRALEAGVATQVHEQRQNPDRDGHADRLPQVAARAHRVRH